MGKVEPLDDREDIVQQLVNEKNDEAAVFELGELLAKADPKNAGYEEAATKAAGILDSLAVKLRDRTSTPLPRAWSLTYSQCARAHRGGKHRRARDKDCNGQRHLAPGAEHWGCAGHIIGAGRSRRWQPGGRLWYVHRNLLLQVTSLPQMSTATDSPRRGTLLGSSMCSVPTAACLPRLFSLSLQAC